MEEIIEDRRTDRVYEVRIVVQVPSGETPDGRWNPPQLWNWNGIFGEADEDLPPHLRCRFELQSCARRVDLEGE